jgi:L-alanine-DL-glutamate epimerase-like enolase superfamily enzyme
MKIKSIDILPCLQRQDDPTWKFALGQVPIVEGWLLAIKAEDGTTGYGYAHALIHLGSTYEALRETLTLLIPRLIGKNALGVEAILTEIDGVILHNNQSKAAIDCALHDLAAKLIKVPLYQLFGGKVRDGVPQMRIVPIKQPDAMANEAGTLADKGYGYLKVKVGGDVDLDVARIKAIRQRVGEAVKLMVDPNQSYTPKNAIAALRRMEEYGVDLAEQPIRAGDLKGLELVTHSVTMAIEADEGAVSLDDVMRLVSNRIVDSISLKIPKMGGLRNVATAARICQAGNIRYRIGASFGPQILPAQALHLAASFPRLDYACELAEFDHLQDDPFSGLTIRDGALSVPDAVGSGVVFDSSVIKAT